MRKRLIQLMAAALAVSMTPLQSFAAIPDAIYVGDVVSITAADLKVNSGYLSLSELSDKYTEQRSNAISNNTSIDSSTGSINTGNTIIDTVLNGVTLPDSGQSVTDKTLSYDEFMNLIGKQKTEIDQKYQAAKQNAQNQQKKGSQEAANELKDVLETSKDGTNPVTGEKYSDSEPGSDHDHNIYDSLKNKQAVINWINNAIKSFFKNQEKNDKKNEQKAEEAEEQYKQEYLEEQKKIYSKLVESGDHSLVPYDRMDKSEYEEDELVYEAENTNYTDVKYKCATCGEVYGFEASCSCGKFLLNTVHKYFYDMKPGFSASNDFGTFGSDGTANQDSWLAEKDISLGPIEVGGKLYCGLCNKDFTLKSLEFKSDENDQFYFGSNGTWICGECLAKSDKESDSKLVGDDGTNWNGTTLDDTSEWSNLNPHREAFALPVKITDYSDYDFDSVYDEVYEGLTDEQKETIDYYYQKYLDAKEEIENAPSDVKPDDYDAIKELVDLYNDYFDEINAESEEDPMPNRTNGDYISDDIWTEEEEQNAKDAINKLVDDGIPPEDYWNDDTTKIKDTSQYDDGVNKVFKEWPADQSQWTEKQRELYNEFKEKYGTSKALQDTLQELVDTGVISKDKTTSEILSGIDKYIASFTAIDESVTINVMIDSGDEREVSQQQSFTAQGAVTVNVYDPDGSSIITDYTITDSIPYRFCPQVAGTYKINRKIRLYDVTWKIVTCTYDIKAEAVLPDGSTVLLAEKQITRVKEDKSGMNTSNMREVSASTITVNVKERQLDINKQDFYDTERIS